MTRDAVLALGALVNGTGVAARHAAAEVLLALGSPAEDNEDMWAALLDQPGLNRYAALACFVAASADTPGDWRPRRESVNRDWQGRWAFIIHSHEAEAEPERWLKQLVQEGAASAAALIVGDVGEVRARIDRQLGTGVWEADPDDPTDGGRPVSAGDMELLRSGAGDLEAWLATPAVTLRRPGSRRAIMPLISKPASVSYRPWDIGTGVQGYAWDATNPRAVLLLQHGYAEHAERYTTAYGPLVPRLLELGISVYAFDLPGHGRSPGRRGLTDVDQAVSHHLAARRKLAPQPLPVFLFGHSLGGIITATSVVREPDGVEGVILSSGALHVTTNPLTRAAARLLATVAPTLPIVALDRSGLAHDRAVARALDEDPLAHHGRMPAGLAASMFAGRANWDRYTEWQAPTLVIHGTEDVFTEPVGSRRLLDAIGSRDKTLHLVEGGYHELLNDTQGAETLEVVLDWLRRHMPGPEPGP